VVKLVDTPDSKSGAFKSVPVQVRPPVPTCIFDTFHTPSTEFTYTCFNWVFCYISYQ